MIRKNAHMEHMELSKAFVRFPYQKRKYEETELKHYSIRCICQLSNYQRITIN